MLDIKEAMTYPLKDENWVVKVLIGTLLGIIPIVNFFSVGYAYQIFKKAVNKETLALPEWDNWGELFLKGLMIVVISIIYLIIPGIILGIGAGLTSSAAMRSAQGYSAVGMGVIGGLFIFIGGILYLIAALILPMVLAHYAKNNDDFGSIFKFGEIIGNIFKVIGDYILALVVIVGITIVIGLVGAIPFLGWIVLIAVSFYLWLVIYALLGMACSGAYA